MTDTKNSRLTVFTALATSALVLTACDDFARFKQERYECGYNRHGLIEMDIRSTKIGDTVATTFTNGKVMMEITESTDSAFTLVKDNIIIRIDRASGAVRMTKGSRYLPVSCKKTEFRM